MSDSIIQVTNLSKSYTIFHEGRESYTTIRDVMAKKAKKIFSFPSSLRGGTTKQSPYKEEFWALKDVSFKINQGDRVGIIGRNGAGKSTLLKILSRITEPTTGEIKIKGRVASLLEVGTGFHPELTGRENIFLNGAILGMSRSEIKKHFDAIVDFAETEKFLDTPVKRYSSGMYVRLAFAVAAHLEPEILVVDEVLAVGDAQFQKKCLGKMEDVSKNEGRTILFVSHNINAIKKLCSKGIFLNKGEIELIDNIHKSIESYLSFSNREMKKIDNLKDAKHHGSGELQFRKVEIKTREDIINSYLPFQENLYVESHFTVYKKLENVIINIFIDDQMGTRFLMLTELNSGIYRAHNFEPGEYKLTTYSKQVFLPGKGYTISLFAGRKFDGMPYDYLESIVSFDVSRFSHEIKDDYIWDYNHGFIQENAFCNIEKIEQ